MGNIVLLDELTINKIAAGEVIERPASVVKELMENSIDAGATNITVEIKNGGITYIRITDNGKGFLPDDMEIAFERHATSKIRTAKDLELVKSMGFRGEALASIAAIARVELTSKTEDSELGYKIVVEGGKIISKEIVGCPKGTTIIVENLFYNTPVRYKFLKKDFTELGYIEDAVTRLALVNPEIAVKLINLGKNIIQTTGSGSIKDVVYSIYGKEIAENIINIDYKYENMHVTGCVGNAVIAKNSRANQLFFVNRRFVKDKTLSSAAEQAFKGFLPAGKYGFLILNVEIDSQKIDVNVHPAKLEIRFQDESQVFKLIYHAIKEAFEPKARVEENEEVKDETTEIPDVFGKITKIVTEDTVKHDFNDEDFVGNKLLQYGEDEEQNKDEDFPVNPINLVEDLYNSKMKESILGDINNNLSVTSKENNSEENVINSIESIVAKIDEAKDEFAVNTPASSLVSTPEPEKVDTEDVSKNEEKDLDKSFEEMYKKTFGIVPVSKDNNTVEEKEKENEQNSIDTIEVKNVEPVTSFKSKMMYSPVKYKFVGIAFSSYIIIEIEDDLYVLDQKLANERIIFEKLKESYKSSQEESSQQMLLPDIINLTNKEMDILKDNILIFRKVGFDVEEFGEATVRLSGVPSLCMDLDTKELFLKCLNEINTIARISKQEIEDKILEIISCKVAENTKTALTFEEVDVLMRKLLTVKNPFTSENEKGIAIKLTKAEIDKKFNK